MKKKTAKIPAIEYHTFNVRISGQLLARNQTAAYRYISNHFLALAEGKEVAPLLPDGIERVTME